MNKWELLGALSAINDLACFASEEDPSTQAAVLLQIGERARAAISLPAFTETQRSSSGARSDKTEMEGGVSRTEPALTDEQIEALAAEHAETGKYEGYFVWFKFHNSSHLIRFARAIATKSHPSGDQGL